MRLLFALAGGACLALDCAAIDLRPQGIAVQAGVAQRGTQTESIGLVWPWAWRHDAAEGQLSGITEGFISRWSTRDGDQRLVFTQMGVLPMLRYRAEAGRSPWFIEFGVGLSVTDRIFRTNGKQFSTRFNFADGIGGGRSFGAGGRQELSLRFTHFSNGGIRRPNPGENVVRLRYAVMF